MTRILQSRCGDRNASTSTISAVASRAYARWRSRLNTDLATVRVHVRHRPQLRQNSFDRLFNRPSLGVA